MHKEEANSSDSNNIGAECSGAEKSGLKVPREPGDEIFMNRNGNEHPGYLSC